MKKLDLKFANILCKKFRFSLFLVTKNYSKKEIRVRSLDGTDLGAMTIEGFADFLQEKINQKN